MFLIWLPNTRFTTLGALLPSKLVSGFTLTLRILYARPLCSFQTPKREPNPNLTPVSNPMPKLWWCSLRWDSQKSRQRGRWESVTILWNAPEIGSWAIWTKLTAKKSSRRCKLTKYLRLERKKQSLFSRAKHLQIVNINYKVSSRIWVQVSMLATT